MFRRSTPANAGTGSQGRAALPQGRDRKAPAGEGLWGPQQLGVQQGQALDAPILGQLPGAGKVKCLYMIKVCDPQGVMSMVLLWYSV